MKTYLVILASVLLVLGIVTVGFAAESAISSQVTVNEYTSVTIIPCADPLSFGSGDPGQNDLPVSCQAGTGAVAVANGASSNVAINVSTKGTNFTSGGNTIAVNKLEFDESNSKPSPTTLSTSYQISTPNLAISVSAGVWYWIDIPGSSAPGTYAGTLSVKGQQGAP